MFSAITRSIFGHSLPVERIENEQDKLYRNFVPDHPVVTAIIYCRISSEQQSLDAQEFSCKKFCEDRDINISQIIRETGSARSLKNLKNLNSIIKNNSNITIVVYSIDRFCRNTSDSIAILKVMKRKNINLISVTDSIDLSTASGKHAFRMRMSEAELESDLISERVRRSVAFRRARGDYFGRPNFGYRTTVLHSGKRIKQVDPSEQSVIRFIRNCCYEFLSQEEFTSELYILLEIYEKPEDFFVPVVFEAGAEGIDGDEAIFLPGVIVTPGIISDILNEYEILKRNKRWTGNSVYNIYNQNDIVTRLREVTI